MSKKKFKILYKAVLSVCLLLSMVLPMTNITLADEKSEFLNAVSGDGYGDSVESYYSKAEKSYVKYRDDTISWYIQYLLEPGHYINDVTNASLQEGYEEVITEHNGRKYTCLNDGEPQNLLNHNCDIPAFSTELLQNITKDATETGIINGERTSATTFLGMPISIPGDSVPLTEAERLYRYTALELFGYDLEYTSYNGEYDHIVVSSQARLLANVGFWGKMGIAGNAIWKGVENTFNQWFNGWVFTPAKFQKPSPGFTSGIVSVAMDTSDANIVTSHGWKRPFFNDTLYNAHYLSDKQIAEKVVTDFLDYFKAHFFEEIEKDPEAKKILHLMPNGEDFPVFIFNPQLYTEESKKAVTEYKECTDYNKTQEETRKVEIEKERNRVIQANLEIDLFNTRPENFNKKKEREVFDEKSILDKYPLKSCGEEPELVVVPEAEQFANWKKEDIQVAFDNDAKSVGIDCFSSAEVYKDIVACWTAPFSKWATETLKASNTVPQAAMKEVERKYFEENPRSDMSQAVNHYVCADEEGNPIGDTISDWKYVYTQNNTKTAEYLTEGCSVVRPSIEGGKFGTGDGASTDTRYLEYARGMKSTGLGFFGGLGKMLSVFFTKVTNTVLSLSFSNIFTKLGVDVMIGSAIATFRDSIFFPFSIIAMAVFGLYTVIQLFNRGAKPIRSILQGIALFMLSTLILLNTNLIVKHIETVPNYIDTILAEIVLSDNPVKNACNATGDNAKIREMQCNVWSIGVLKPWLLGQWGTSNLDDLDSDNFTNTNQELVGFGIVNMGNKEVVDNFAIWQLSKMKSGTITTEDTSKPTGITSKSLYKLVDLQAGPKNGEKSDDRYFNTWAGNNIGLRKQSWFFAGIISLLLMLTIGGLALVKLETTVEFSIRLFLLPFMLLLGLFPKGKGKLLEYVSDLLALYARRLFSVLIMLITLNIMNSVIGSSQDYHSVLIGSVAIILAIFLYWKEIFNKLQPSPSPVTGGAGGWKEKLPPSIKFALDHYKNTTKGAVAGFIGGAIGSKMADRELKKDGYEPVGSSLLQGGMAGASKAIKKEQGMTFNRQRRIGFGVLTAMKQASDTGKEASSKRLTNPTKKMVTEINIGYQILRNKKEDIQHEIDKLEDEIARAKKTATQDMKDNLEKLNQSLTQINEAISVLDDVTIGKDNYDWKQLENGHLNEAVLKLADRKKVRYNAKKNIREVISRENAVDEFISNVKEAKHLSTENRTGTISEAISDFVHRDIEAPHELLIAKDKIVAVKDKIVTTGPMIASVVVSTMTKQKIQSAKEEMLNGIQTIIHENEDDTVTIVQQTNRSLRRNYYDRGLGDVTKENIEKVVAKNMIPEFDTPQAQLYRQQMENLYEDVVEATGITDRDSAFAHSKSNLYQQPENPYKKPKKKRKPRMRTQIQADKKNEIMAEIMNRPYVFDEAYSDPVSEDYSKHTVTLGEGETLEEAVKKILKEETNNTIQPEDDYEDIF